MQEVWSRKGIKKDALSPISIAIPFAFSEGQENSAPENPTTAEQFCVLRNTGCGLSSLSCTCKWVPEHSTQQRQRFHPGYINWHVSINLFASSHCGAPQLTTGENEMGYSVGFLVSAIDGKGIQGVLSFPLHHWQNKFKTWGGLGSSPKTSPWACIETRTGLGRITEERGRPLACQVRLKHLPAL